MGTKKNKKVASKKKTGAKKSKNKTAEPKPRDEVYLELDGKVHIVSVENGITERTEIDPDMVLRILLDFVGEAIKVALKDDKWLDGLKKMNKKRLAKSIAGLKKK
jgi:hypothetical protein